jgi:hypothetical protein
MRNFILILVLLLCFVATIAQQKSESGIHKYWAGISTALISADAGKKLGTVFFVDAGIFARRSFMFGGGGGIISFADDKTATVLYGYVEKNAGNDKRKIFVYAKPGIAFANKAEKQIERIGGGLAYYKKQPGLHLQGGVGIKWMVKRHSFFISTGYARTAYNIFAKEYRAPVDPYNPFKEEPIIHKYELTFGRLLFSMGFTF